MWPTVVADHRRRLIEHIGRTAVHLIREHGWSEVSMSRLATAAGVARATLYKHVPDVETAVLGYLTAEIDDFHARLAEELTAIDDPTQALDHIVGATVAHLTDAAHHERASIAGGALLSHRGADLVAAHRARLLDQTAQVLERGVAAGQFRANLNAAATAKMIHACVAAMLEVPADEDQMPELRAFLYSGLRYV
jgi:AcrR family transcriptional regulator